MTLAPELPGALELIDELAARGITVSCGHSDATAEEATAAFDRGARTVTHLFNAMRPFSHRDPGIVGAALARADVIVQIIVDGVHLAPATVRSSGARRPAASRSSPTRSPRGRRRTARTASAAWLEVQDGAVRREAACSPAAPLTMIEAVRNLHALGVPLEDALRRRGRRSRRASLGLPTSAGSRSGSRRTSSSSTTVSRSSASSSGGEARVAA